MKLRIAFAALLLAVVATFLGLRSRRSEVVWARWSDPATWNGRLPRAGENVVVPRGRRVLLDVSPPALGRLEVEGELAVEDADLSLRAETVLVSGRLAIGTRKGVFFVPFGSTSTPRASPAIRMRD